MIRKFGLISLVVVMLMSLTAAGQEKNKYVFRMPDIESEVSLSDRWIGVVGRDVEQADLQAFKLKELSGVIVTQIKSGSPAAKVDLKANDVILEYEHQKLMSVKALRRMVDETPIGRDVTLLISRDGSTREIKINVAKKSWEFEVPPLKKIMPYFFKDEEIEKDCPYIGVELQPLTPELRKYFGARENAGVLVAQVVKDSIAEKSGFQVGDVIVRINQDEIREPYEVREHLCDAQSLDALNFTVIRNRRELNITVSKGAGRVEKT